MNRIDDAREMNCIEKRAMSIICFLCDVFVANGCQVTFNKIESLWASSCSASNFKHALTETIVCRFVTFEDDSAVEKVFAMGNMHELAGKRVEIKTATPRGSGSFSARASSLSGGTQIPSTQERPPYHCKILTSILILPQDILTLLSTLFCKSATSHDHIVPSWIFSI